MTTDKTRIHILPGRIRFFFFFFCPKLFQTDTNQTLSTSIIVLIYCKILLEHSDNRPVNNAIFSYSLTVYIYIDRYIRLTVVYVETDQLSCDEELCMSPSSII